MDHVIGGGTATGSDWKLTAGRVALLTLLAAGIGFRIVGLGWGIPSALPSDSTPCRTSFHIDEDDYLHGLMKTSPGSLDLDVRDYHWGTLQFYLVGAALGLAQSTGYVKPWRESFLNWNPDDFGRLYAVGRAVSALAGVLTLPVVFVVARSLENAEAGLAAAALLAVSPLHVVNSHFLTSDVTMIFFLVLSLYFFIASLGQTKPWSEIAGAFFLGLAISAKYNAAFLVFLWIIRDFARRASWRVRVPAYTAMCTGFLLGEPYALIHPFQVAESVYRAHFLRTAGMDLLPWWRLLLEQGTALARFGMQWTVAIPAALGFVCCLTSTSKNKAALAAAMALMTVSLIPARWPMLRYTLPLVPLAAISAALLVSALPVRPWLRTWTVVLVGLAPLLVSWAHVNVLVGEHPGNRASDWIRTNAEPGARIGQIWPEIPPLDARLYDLQPLRGLFPGDPPGPRDLDRKYLVLDDLPIQPFSPDFRTRLQRDFTHVAEFRSDPRIGPWTLSEEGAPHDWKYTHPVVRIYSRKQDSAPGSDQNKP